MARPVKQAMDYFSMDTNFDDKTELYVLEKEGFGLAVLVVAWQLIYGNQGYYAVDGDDFCLLVKKRVSGEINAIKECINSCLRRGLFSEDLHDQYGILTSRGIQKRFLEVSRSRKQVEWVDEFSLIDISNNNNLVSKPINLINLPKNYTKESKGKKRKEEKSNSCPNPADSDEPTIDLFELFWEAYPRKEKKQAVKKIWDKLKPTSALVQKMLATIVKFKSSPQWLEEKGKYIPLPSSWLNAGRWEDEILKPLEMPQKPRTPPDWRDVMKGY